MSNGGWIAITGLPLHWWSLKFFNRIGEACGGLIEVDLRTSNFAYPINAKLRVRTNEIGLLPSDLRIANDGEVHFVQIRPLSPAIHSHLKPKPHLADRRHGLKMASDFSLPTGRRFLTHEQSCHGSRKAYNFGSDMVGGVRGIEIRGMGNHSVSPLGKGEAAEEEGCREVGINEMGRNLQIGNHDKAEYLARGQHEGIRGATHMRQLKVGGPTMAGRKVGFPVGSKFLTGPCGFRGYEGTTLIGDCSWDVLLDIPNNFGPIRNLAKGGALLGSNLVVGSLG